MNSNKEKLLTPAVNAALNITFNFKKLQCQIVKIKIIFKKKIS